MIVKKALKDTVLYKIKLLIVFKDEALGIDLGKI